mmetsp:Transcript_18525/g.27865  ORF Transcript_18525/g.27865 Transcript_18525/m.27865 type:complete len:503 (-) Transcript_18525:204-1712(-)
MMLVLPERANLWACPCFLILLAVGTYLGRKPLLLSDGVPSHHDVGAWPPVSCMLYGANPVYCMPPDMTEFESFLEGCRSGGWTELQADEALDFIETYASVVDGAPMQGGLPYDNLTKDFQVLNNPPVSQCRDGLWTAYAFGPFDTYGGYYWTTLKFVLKESAQSFPFTKSGEHYAFSAYFLGSLDENSQMVENPPIHQHHFHFGYAFAVPVPGHSPYNAYTASRGHPSGGAPATKMSNHGDDVCPMNEGGSSCTFRRAPDGFAYFERGPLSGTNTFNDIRPEPSRRLRSWQAVVLKEAQAVTTRTKNIAEGYISAHMPNHFRETFLVSTTHDSVTWDFEVVDLRDVISVGMHGHDTYLYDMWWFQGAPDRVFSDVDYAMRKRGVLDDSDDIISRTIQSIRTRQLQPNPAVLSCSYKTHSALEHVIIDGTPMDIRRRVSCPVAIHSNHHVVVALIRHHQTPRFPKVVPMHALVRIAYGSNTSRAMNPFFSGPSVKLWEEANSI